MTHLLDSSAWLAHLFGEPGVDDVTRLFNDPNVKVSISALSIPEVYGRLSALGQQIHWTGVWENYSALFSKVLAADAPIAHRAIQLRAATPQRLPTVDALIAATAAEHDLILVHRDPHLSAIPTASLQQMRLP
ncbi:MAG: PIN domain-containing protein [Anaerolineae bacterium]|nr:PIN domain-containing protein [Anaerolineae bacterium]MCO5206944.1 PIN domain-containing protein [Anaerolineae bacterium]